MGTHSRIQSFKYAFEGLLTIIKEEANFRVHICLAIIVIIAGIIFKIPRTDWLAVAICIISVLIAEIFNTCIENVLDMLTTEYNPRVKKVKDMAAAAVLLVTVLSVAVGLLIFIPRIF
ncbi:MAG: diacylglycerol kinase family protein [Fusobacteria bacterium]|nr:diacylglycerol kinase family protein [Fusobacteriota bacterium]